MGDLVEFELVGNAKSKALVFMPKSCSWVTLTDMIRMRLNISGEETITSVRVVDKESGDELAIWRDGLTILAPNSSMFKCYVLCGNDTWGNTAAQSTSLEIDHNIAHSRKQEDGVMDDICNGQDGHISPTTAVSSNSTLIPGLPTISTEDPLTCDNSELVPFMTVVSNDTPPPRHFGDVSSHFVDLCIQGNEVAVGDALNSPTEFVPDMECMEGLLACSAHGHVSVARVLVEHGVAVDGPGLGGVGMTALQLCALRNHTPMCNWLIAAGASPTRLNSWGTCAIHYLCINGMTDCLATLEPMFLTSRSSGGRVGLHYAAGFGHISTVSILLDKCLQVDPRDEYGNTPLHYAAEMGMVEVVSLLVKKNRECVNRPNARGATPLLVACRGGHLETAKVLYHHGANMFHEDKGWNGSVHYACHSGSVPLVSWLLEEIGYNPSTDNKDKVTPMDVAKKGEHVELVDYLRSHFAREFREKAVSTMRTLPVPKERAFPEGRSVRGATLASTVSPQLERSNLTIDNLKKHLHLNADGGERPSSPNACVDDESSSSDNGSTRRYMVERRKKQSMRGEAWDHGEHMSTATSHTVKNISHSARSRAGNVSTGLELDKSSDTPGDKPAPVVRDYTVTPYLTSCAQGDLKSVMLYVEQGRSVTACNDNGSQGIHYAASGGHLSVVKYLVDQGAPLNVTNHSGVSALHFACQQCHVQVIRWLVSIGADTTLCNSAGLTPIHLLCTNGDIAVATFEWFAATHMDLQYFQANSSSEDKYRYSIMPTMSLLHCACLGEGYRLVEAVINAGVSVHERDEAGRTALHIAAEKMNFEAIRHICEHAGGQDVINAVDEDGKTAIFEACLAGAIKTAKYLHGCDADITIPNKRGSTCMHAACQSGNFRLVKWLVGLGADINACNHSGFRPGDFAWKCDDDVVMSYLRSMHGLDHIVLRDIRTACVNNNIQKLQEMYNEGYDLHNAIISVSTLTEDTSIIHEVCRYGLIDIMQFFCETYEISLTIVDNLGYTPMHYAVMQGHVALVRWLVARNVSALQLTSHGRTSLHIAAIYGHVDLANYFVERGVDVDCRGGAGLTPLSDACAAGMLNVVKYFVDKGADLGTVDQDNRTLVHRACESGSVEVVEYLVGKGLEFDEEDNSGITPFLVACENGHLPLCELLLSRGCNIYQKGGHEDRSESALHFAGRKGHVNIVKWLMGIGLNPKSRNLRGDSAADAAALDGQHDVSDWLIENQVTYPEDRMVHFLEPQLSWALDNSFFRFARHCLDEMLSESISEEYEREDGSTLLHSAAAAGNAILVVKLVQVEGWDVERRSHDGWSAVHYACSKGHLEVVKALKSVGAKMKVRDSTGNTGLHVAADCGHTNVVRYFAKSLRSLDLANSYGWTALHYAASHGFEESVRCLVECGACGKVQAEGGVTALHVACHGRQQAIACYLVRNGAVDISLKDDEGLTAADVARMGGMPILSEWLEEIARGSDINEIPDPIEIDYDRQLSIQARSQGGQDDRKAIEDLTSTEVCQNSKSSIFSCISNAASSQGPAEFASSHSLDTAPTINPVITYSNDDLILNKSFIEAIENGDIAMANSLLIAGASPRFATPTSKNTALHTACTKGDIIAVKYLCDHGADVNARNLGGMTPLHIATDREFAEVSLYLIREGAMLGAVNKAGQSPLHIMASRGMRDAVRELAALPSRFIREQDVNTKTNANQTVLHLAIAAGHSELLEDLLRLNIAIDATDDDGQTSLHLACAMSDFQACMLLLSNGADPNKSDNRGWSALHFACVAGNIKLVQALVDHDGIIHCRTRNGDSLLHASCQHSRLLISKWLVSCGLDISQKNHKKQSPAMYALASSDPAMVEWVKKL